jgi:hypothetical protein
MWSRIASANRRRLFAPATRCMSRRWLSGQATEGGGGGIGAWYYAQLEARPILTKSLTSAAICAGGDFICQVRPQALHERT